MSEIRSHTVGILIYDDVEPLDFCGPFGVFSAARFPDDAIDELPFKVLIIAPENRVISCTGGLLVTPHYTIDQHPPLDILVVPGGDYLVQRANTQLLEWIAGQSQSTAVTASVCNGAFLLGSCGLLDGLRATTYWGYIEQLRRAHPTVEVVPDAGVVDAGRIVTASGVSAGIDMALHLVARFCGEEAAVGVAQYMEYAWTAPGQTVAAS